MRALVLGVGRMGTAIAWAMDKFGFHVTGMDTNPEAANNIPFKVNNNPDPKNEFFIVKDVEDIFAGIVAQQKPDIIISSLPYHQTEEVGTWCVDNGLRYCDLGGRVDVSAAINEWAEKKARKPIFTDLGLAPGWINILAEEGYKSIGSKATKVGMYVGGLPKWVDTSNPLKYETTWSIDGLINEYADDCEVLENGKLKKVKGMSGLERVNVFGAEFEAFFTSGGAAHTIKSMKNRGVLNCYYKTLRYVGHRNCVQFLINKCDLDKQTLEKIFTKGCPPSVEGDIVIMKANVWSGENPSLIWTRQIQINSDEKFSAMQKATAFSISSVAKIMAEGKMEGNKEQHRDYWTQYPKSLSYADVPFDEFDKNLRFLGVYDE